METNTPSSGVGELGRVPWKIRKGKQKTLKEKVEYLQNDVLRQLSVERIVLRQPPQQQLAERPQRRHGVLHLHSIRFDSIHSRRRGSPPRMVRR